MKEALFIGDAENYAGDVIDPIWIIDYKTDSELLEWDKRTSVILRDEYRDRNQRTTDHFSRYRGEYRNSQAVVGGKRLEHAPKKSDVPVVVVNHSQDLVEQKVAVQLKYRPGYEVSPDSLESSDKSKAIAVKKMLESIDYWSGLPKHYHKPIRHAIIAGQGWCMPYWNENLGENTKEVLKFKLPLRNDTGEREVETKKRKGEISFRFLDDREVYLFPDSTADDVQGFCWEHVENTDILRAQYHEKADEIVETRGASQYYQDTDYEYQKNHTVVREYFIPSSKVLEDGLYFAVTDETVLVQPRGLDIPRLAFENDPFKNLPIARLTDVDIDGDLNGYPSFAFLVPLQIVYDKWFSLCHKNVFLFCHPKWKYQVGSVDEARLSNASFLLPYRSQVAPQLEVYQALTQDLLKFGELILTSMEKVMRISGVSRGAPPPGTRAAASLYFYDEQEQTANSIFRRKMEDFVCRLQMLKLAIISTKYKNDKSRVIWTLGKNNQWLADEIDTKVLGEKYTVRIKSASNLPDSKFARIQALMDLAQTFPNLVTQEHVAEMIDFGQQEQFLDYARCAVMASEAENEKLMAGTEIPTPARYEMQITHWKSHVKLAQDPNFKAQPEKIRKKIEAHIGAHELMMLANPSPYFKQQILQIPQFPLFAQLPDQQVGGQMPAPSQAGAGQVGRPPTKPSQELASDLAGVNPDQQQKQG